MKRNTGSALILVLFISLLLAATAGAVVTYSNHRAKSARFAHNQTSCFYAADSGIEIGRAVVDGHSVDIPESVNGALLSITIDIDGDTVEIRSTATKEQSEVILVAYVVDQPIGIPYVSSLYLSQESVLNLDGAAFTIEGNDKSGIATNGVPTELALMIDESQHDQITGLGGEPSIGYDDTVDFDSLFTSLSRLSGSAFGTLDDPLITSFDGSIAGNTEAAGVLLVDGDLTISGTLDFHGLILVTGDVKITGDVIINGSIMIQGDIKKIAGSVEIQYDGNALSGIEEYVNGLDNYSLVAWRRVK